MANILKGTYSWLTDRDFDNLVFDDYGSITKLYEQVANVVNTKEPYLRRGLFVGTGPLTQTNEDSSFWNLAIAQQYVKTINWTEYTGGYEVSRIAMEDDYNGMLKQFPKALSRSLNYTVETIFWDLINSGFLTTRTGGDGAALFSASHTSLGAGGSTQSNLGTAAALSIYSLRQAKTAFKTLKNYNGQPTPIAPKILMCHPTYEDVAMNLCEAQFNPSTGDNELNPYSTIGMKYIVNPYMTSTTAWVVLGDVHDLNLYWRRSPKTEIGDGPATGSRLYYLHTRLTADFVDWRGTYGNAGA
jgi:phage major head subunit gpT-like protein